MCRAAVVQIAFDFVSMRVHTAFDVRHILEFAHVHGTLVMYRTIRINRVRVAYIARNTSPALDSLPSDQISTLGWL